MSRDVKYLLGFVPWAVTFLLLLVGFSSYIAFFAGGILAILYGLGAIFKKFYKDPPKHYRSLDYLGLGVYNWFLLISFVANLESGTPLAWLRIPFPKIIMPLVFAFLVVLSFFKPSFVNIQSKPKKENRKFSVFVSLCGFAVFGFFYAFSAPLLLQFVVPMLMMLLLQYVIIKRVG